MKIRAEKLPDGKFELFLEIPPIELPCLYSEKDIVTLENNKVLLNRDSYYDGMSLEFSLKKKISKRN